MTLIERLLQRTERTDGCWLFHGHLDEEGYGRMKVQHRGVRVHRVAYESFVGPIPTGLQLDHLCRVRNCVNPSHLEAVDTRTNVLRGEGISAKNARKTHCLHGHPFTEENTYVVKGPNPKRQCRSCWSKKQAAA